MNALLSWRHDITPRQWRTLLAAHLGWLLDGMDIMLYAFALLAIQKEFGLTSAAAGALASITLLASAAGGAFAGVLADRWGRVPVLIGSMLVYSLFTGAAATSMSVLQLAFWRALVGFGLGGEWSAGSVLIAETWPPEHRGKAVGFMQAGWALGYILAAALAAWILPIYGWRTLFVIGTAPALLTLWIRRGVPESEIWRAVAGRRSPDRSMGAGLKKLLEPRVRGRILTATGLSASLLFAYWGLFTWIPTYLAAPLSRGGAGFDLVKSMGWIVPMQIGAFLGYILFGFLADRFGRRPVFVVFVLASAVLVPVYGLSARHANVLMLLGPLIGFFGHGYFSVFGAMFAELFDSDIRATAQGLCYNGGRAASAAAPFFIGMAADRYGIGSALGMTAGFYVLGAALIFALPETRGGVLR
ncbi:MAG: MFS transporter [Elusimicrobiota bacterium]